MFKQIPIEIWAKITGSDYSEAEKICPQKKQIAKLMKEPSLEFGYRSLPAKG
jgi:hypothetical protein